MTSLIAIGAGLIALGIVSKKKDSKDEIKVPEPPTITSKKKLNYISYDLWIPVYGTVLAVDIEEPLLLNTTSYDEDGVLIGEWKPLPEKLDLTNMVKDAQSKKYILDTYVLPKRRARLRYTFRLNNGKYQQRELDEPMVNVLFL